jgi:hypothetical protein
VKTRSKTDSTREAAAKRKIKNKMDIEESSGDENQPIIDSSGSRGRSCQHAVRV